MNPEDNTEMNYVNIYVVLFVERDGLCGIVGRVPGCEPRGPGFVSLRYQFF
jgi:hypothetical protein